MTNDSLGAFCSHSHVHIDGATAGPLARTTFAAKDNFAAAGYPTGAGNPDWLRTHAAADRTATAVQMLLDAGATLIGKTNMDELAFSLDGVNSHYGTPVNPNAPDRIPGGSSSGSASATAGSLVDFALGTDTGGSVRVPASLCGIFGFRPTHGRISLDGIVPFSPSFDTVGWFAHDASLLRRVGEVLLGTNHESPSTSARFLVAEDALALCDGTIRSALETALSTMARGNGPIRRVVIAPEGLESWVSVFNVIRGWEVRETLGEWIDRINPAFGPGIRERFERTREITPAAFAEALRSRHAIQARLDSLLDGGNILCLPTVPVVAPLRSSTDAELASYRSRTLNLTSIATVGGVPQVTIPIARVDGCPVGLSLIGARGSDMRVLALAESIHTPAPGS